MIDRVTRLLSPLPLENLGEIVALLVELGGKKKGRGGDISICPGLPS